MTLKYLKTIAIFCIVVLCSCSKEELSERIVGRWEVIELQVDDTSSVQKATDSYFVTFMEDGTMSLLTDVNICTLKYFVDDNDDFNHAVLNCTYACCDSEFSEAIIDAFQTPKHSYNISGRKLTILGSGFIKLKKARDE